MRIPIYQADAFTSRLFGGNPAAVCPLAEPISDELQQSIAIENQLSETAFILREGDVHHLRWFTPGGEVNLCGHATLAAGHIILSELDRGASEAMFASASGPLRVTRTGDRYLLELPSWPGSEVRIDDAWVEALGARPIAVRRTERDIYALLASETEVRELRPDFSAVAQFRIGDVAIDGVGVAASGDLDADDPVDVVSRFFAPRLEIDEDPVTGSAHSTWVPWFAELTGKTEFICRQVSRRRGDLTAALRGDRVELIGGAVTYLRGEIEV